MSKFTAPLLALLPLMVLVPIVGAETNTSRPINLEHPKIAEARTASGAAGLKAEREAAREDFKANREAALATFRESRDKAKAAFTAKLAKIKDETKKLVATRLEDNLNNINQRHTEQFSDRLTKFNTFLGRVITRKDKAKTTGKDVTKAETAITAAQAAITAAQTAVTTQAAKSYTINFTTEADLKTAANAARTQLRADLKATHDKVSSARKMVVDALQALIQVRGVDDDVSASGSAKLGE